MGQVVEERRFSRALGRRLAQIRRRKGLTQAQLQDRVHLTIEYVSVVENGHKVPNLLTLRTWARRGLGVPLDAVLKGLP